MQRVPVEGASAPRFVDGEAERCVRAPGRGFAEPRPSVRAARAVDDRGHTAATTPTRMLMLLLLRGRSVPRAAVTPIRCVCL